MKQYNIIVSFNGPPKVAEVTANTLQDLITSMGGTEFALQRVDGQTDSPVVVLTEVHDNGMPNFQSDKEAWDAMGQAMSIFAAAAAHLKMPFKILGGTTNVKDVTG